jgi:hypothetical protein
MNILYIRCVPLSTQEIRGYDEMICQEVNVVLRDIFLYIEGFNNSTAQQQIRIRRRPSAVRPRKVRQESPGTTVGLLQLRSSVVENPVAVADLNLKYIFCC